MSCRKTDTSPVGRKTRTASRAATTTRAQNSRTTRNTTKSKKTRSQEPICNVEKAILAEQNVNEDSVKTPTKQAEEEMEVEEESMTWTQSANVNILALNHRINSEQCRTPVSNKLVIDVDKTPVNSARTPIGDFSKMNVKEKVNAYETIVLLSPGTVEKKKKTSPKLSPHTPTGVQTVTNTPDTVVVNKVQSTNIRLSSDSGHDSVEEMSEVSEKSTSKKDTPRLSAPRESHRKSLRQSLHVLPSRQKLSGVQPVVSVG